MSGPDQPRDSVEPDADGDIPELSNAELVQLRVRVIALESLLIAVLADGSESQRATARDMARYISPRPGFTAHPLTIQAAGHVRNLVDRADQLRSTPRQSAGPDQ